MQHRQTLDVFLCCTSAMQADILENRERERYVFCQRGVLEVGDKVIRIRTRDVSLEGFGIVSEHAVSAGHTCHLRFSTIVGDRISIMQFDCVSSYCILEGLNGYRVGLKLIQQNSASQKLHAALMQRCASLRK